MQDAVETGVRREHLADLVQVAFVQHDLARHDADVPGREVVDHLDRVAGVEQLVHDHGPDVSGTAGHEQLHGSDLGPRDPGAASAMSNRRKCRLMRERINE